MSALRVGLLWYDNTDKSLAEKIGQALAYFQAKYNATPTLAQVNQKALSQAVTLWGVEVTPSRSILPGHIWIGRELTPAKVDDDQDGQE